MVKRFRQLLQLGSYLAPYRLQMIGAVLLMLLASIITVVLPLLTRSAVDDYILQDNAGGLYSLLAIGLTLAVILQGANLIRARAMARAGQGSIRAIRQDLFAKLQDLPTSFFDTMPVGKLVTRLTSDVDALAELVSNAIANLVVESAKLVGFLALMLWLDWRLTLVTLVFFPLLLFAITVLSAKIGRAEDQVREEASLVNANVQESISGIRVIGAMNGQRFFAEKFQERNDKLLQAGNRAIAIFSYFWPIIDFNWLISVAAILFFGSRWVLDGTTTIGTLIAFITYTGLFFSPLRGLAQAYRLIGRALAGAVRINQIFAEPVEEEPLPIMPPIQGDVVFDNVTFGYDAQEPVLHGISMAVKAGQTVALVGHTGAGKTSIISLLCRFYQPQQGRILVDGIDINTRLLSSCRRQIGLVLQEPYLFSGTLRDNLQFGASAASDEQMHAALVAVGLEDLVKDSRGLDLVLTERGSNLSTGQRQLLSFARALLKDPPILILDEATAHVDTLTEYTVQKAMAQLRHGRTAFVIAHRLSTIRSADCIFVMGKGTILESGTHEELMAQDGEYADLIRWQFPQVG